MFEDSSKCIPSIGSWASCLQYRSALLWLSRVGNIFAMNDLVRAAVMSKCYNDSLFYVASEVSVTPGRLFKVVQRIAVGSVIFLPLHSHFALFLG